MALRPDDDLQSAAEEVAKLRQLVELRKRELDARRRAVAGDIATIADIEAELTALSKRKAMLELEHQRAVAARKAVQEEASKTGD